MSTTLSDFIVLPQWVAWRNENRRGKPTKVPYFTIRREAEADNPSTWQPHDQAVVVRDAIVNGTGGGVGIELGQCGDRWIVGIDLDTCRHRVSGQIEQWAQEIIDRFGSYTEISPSGTGVKVFLLIDPADVTELRRIMGKEHGRQFKRANGSGHPPSIELYTSNRYFAVTWQGLADAPADLRTVPLDDLRWLVEQAGPAFSGKAERKRDGADGHHDDGDTTSILHRLDTVAKHSKAVAAALLHATTMRGGSRSEGALGLGASLRRAGWSYQDMKAALLACPATREWAKEKLAEGERQFERIWQARGEPPNDSGQQQHPDADLEKVEWRNVRLSDWQGKPIPERAWILPDWVPLEQTTGLYGVAGVNKTDWLVQLMMATSLGLPFCGYQLTPQPVCGLFCEDTEAEIVRRATRIAAHYGRSLGDFPDFHFASLVGFDATEFVTFDGPKLVVGTAMLKFDQMIAEVGAKLAVLDTAPDFFGGEEISRRQVAQFIRRLDAVSITRGCALLFSAHPSVRGMASGEMDSGTTGWGAKVRARLSLHDPGEPDADEAKDGRGRRTTPVSTDHRVLTRHKSNYARQGETIDLVCRNGVFTTAALDPERAAARQRGPGRDVAAEAKFLDLFPMAEQAAGYIHSSANAHGHYAPAVFAARKDGGGFSKAEFTRAMQRLLEAGRLRQQPFGPPSHGRFKLALVAPNS